MRTAFIADVHLTPRRPAAARQFKDFLRAAAEDLSRLYILGDLFDYWVGDDGGDFLGHADTIAALRAAADAGLELFFLPGNRDFLIGDEFAARAGCKLLADPTVIHLDGRAVLLTHGDRLCTDDTEHQAAREQMLSAKWRRVFLAQTLDARMQTAAALRRQSEHAKREKSRAIMDANPTAVAELMRKHNAHILIHGHTHRPAAHNFHLDDKPAARYVLGDWTEQSSALYYQNGAFALAAAPHDRV